MNFLLDAVLGSVFWGLIFVLVRRFQTKKPFVQTMMDNLGGLAVVAVLVSAAALMTAP